MNRELTGAVRAVRNWRGRLFLEVEERLYNANTQQTAYKWRAAQDYDLSHPAIFRSWVEVTRRN